MKNLTQTGDRQIYTILLNLRWVYLSSNNNTKMEGMQRCLLFSCSFFCAVLLHCQRHQPCKQRPRNSHFISFSLFLLFLCINFVSVAPTQKKKKKRKKRTHSRNCTGKKGPSPSLAPDQKPACDTHTKHAEKHTVLASSGNG